MSTPFVVSRWHWRLFAVAVAFVLVAFSPAIPGASAKAPPLATTVLDAEVLAAPAHDAAPIAVIPAGIDVELTGEAAPGFLGVYYDGEAAWVPAQFLSLGDRPGIDTTVTKEDTPLLDAPMREGIALATVPQGQTVILTGASVDGYDAASHDGIGGWINERDLED